MTLQENIDEMTDRIKSEYDTIYASQRYIKELKAERKTLLKELKRERRGNSTAAKGSET